VWWLSWGREKRAAQLFAKGEIGRDDYRGAFVETADQVEQELSTGLREGDSQARRGR